MEIIINHETAMWILLITLSFCALKIGIEYQKLKSQDIIDATVNTLMDAGYLKYTIDSKGEYELIKLDDEDKNG